MIELGKTQMLTSIKSTEFGVYLNSETGDNSSILLPKKYVPNDLTIGDKIKVFVYKDSDDRLIATTLEPKIKLKEVAKLRVKEVTSIGAFLDWGLEKDLLLPFKEQTAPIVINNEYLVALYIDKTKRLCATMKIYDYLNPALIYNKNDKVTGTVYETNEKFGAFVAIDNKYYGLIPCTEIFKPYKVGDNIEARIISVRDDGKLGLSTREQIHIQINTDSELIYEKLIANNGVLPLTDKSDPNIIKKELNLSKNAFKRGVGKLLKENKILLTETSIKLLNRLP